MIDNFYVFKYNLPFDRNRLYNDIVDQHRICKTYGRDNNFYLPEKFSYFSKHIYNYFLQLSRTIFDIELSEKNSDKCWAYVANKQDYRGGIHDHIPTSTINSVYYLTVPDEKSGQLAFYDDSNKHVWNYQPKQDELVIFPNYVKHEALISNTEEYRVSINMEIICNDVWTRTKPI